MHPGRNALESALPPPRKSIRVEPQILDDDERRRPVESSMIINDSGRRRGKERSCFAGGVISK